MSKTINGKKPLSSKPKSVKVVQEPDFFSNRMSISSELREELDKKGLDYRFIDYKKYVENGNVHNRGWTVYRREGKADTQGFLVGNSPDGIIRVGSTVLATRPLNYSEKHRQYLAERAAQYRGFQKTKAEEMRATAREHSLDGIVDSTFDDTDGDEE